MYLKSRRMGPEGRPYGGRAGRWPVNVSRGGAGGHPHMQTYHEPDGIGGLHLRVQRQRPNGPERAPRMRVWALIGGARATTALWGRKYNSADSEGSGRGRSFPWASIQVYGHLGPRRPRWEARIGARSSDHPKGVSANFEAYGR